MIQAYLNWYTQNKIQISWFIIGFDWAVILINLMVGNYPTVLFFFGLAYITFVMCPSHQHKDDTDGRE